MLVTRPTRLYGIFYSLPGGIFKNFRWAQILTKMNSIQYQANIMYVRRGLII